MTRNQYTWFAVFLLIVSIIGLIDSSYLSYASLTGNSLSCSFLDGCNVVAKSPYSRIFGVPLALFGVLFYLLVTGLSAALLIKDERIVRRGTVALGVIGLLFSAYFVYLQAEVIKAFCIYCLISAAATIVIFVLSLGLVPRRIQ